MSKTSRKERKLTFYSHFTAYLAGQGKEYPSDGSKLKFSSHEVIWHKNLIYYCGNWGPVISSNLLKLS